MKKILVLIIWLVVQTSVLLAQSLEKRLSASKTSVIVSLNAHNYKPKGKFQTLLVLDFFRNLDKNFKERYSKDYKVVSAIYRNPEEIGINAFPRSYIFVNSLDSNATMVGVVFGLANSKKFENWANTFWKEADVNKIKNGENAIYLQGDQVVAWNNTCGVIAFVALNERSFYEGINYDDPEYDKKMEERERKNKQRKIDLLKNEATAILQGNANEPLESNANFQTFLQKPHDLGIWLNYEQFTQSFGNLLKEVPELRFGYAERLASRVKSFYKNYYDHILFNTTKGSTTVTYETYLSEKMYQLIGNAFNKRINPEFYKYVEGENLLGMYAVSGDLKVLGNALVELYKNFGEDLSKEGKIIAATTDVLSVMLDEDAILGMLKGDAMVAFTGVKEMETEYTDYEYEGETYLGAVKKKRKEKVAVYVATLSIGNEESLKKIIYLLNVLEGFELQPQGNFYRIKEAGKVQNYLAIDNGVLVITNDLDLISNLKNFKVKKSVESRIQKLTQENPMLVYVNTQAVADAILNHKPDLQAGERKDLLELKNEVGEFQMVGPLLKGKTFYSEGALQVLDKKNNSLASMVRFFNRFFKDRSGMSEPEDITGKKNKKRKKKEH
ncbi:DUF4836 family protein [Raineya orbicola]|jgi:hypothetical protein|uniref:DUF4836 family protein n=1 Tax=Raineya orbicola TaxID=2016530 RepID=A0A2N3IJV3_9BACT|nr:DUF4836 family protein [Raineya orbicola]PKQ70594.1 hypothetical protein Rain11_0324 [Raineya orbicola]